MERKTKWLRSIVLLMLFYLLFFLPLPYYLEGPGNVSALDEIVEIEQENADLPGKYYLTTVGIRQATPAGMISSFLPYNDLISKEDFLGDLEEIETYEEIQQYQMRSSINQAIKAAFDAAEKSYEFDYQGVYILEVIKESDFANSLKVGDLVQEINGQQFESAEDFIDYVANQNVADQVELQIKRDDEELTLTGELIELESGKTGIGIGLVDETRIMTDPEVRIQATDIGGPSAGLMFALELYTQLIDENIRTDHRIAGTGTIGPDGEVGRIGGADKKVVAADAEEIEYFFVPDDDLLTENQVESSDSLSNYDLAIQTAEAIDTDMEIIPVKTLDDAITFLEELSKKESVSKARDDKNNHITIRHSKLVSINE